MKLGAENKKAVRALMVLGVILAGALYYNYSSDSTPSGSSTPATPASPAPVIGNPQADDNVPTPVPGRANNSTEFHPVLRSKRKEDQVDPTKVDPTLRLDLLAKIQDEKPPEAARNLFQIGPAPVKPEDKPKGPEPTVAIKRVMGPPWLPEPPPPPKPTLPAPPPPINVKYYGFASPTATGHKRGFFMDGEDILIKAEGDTLKGHYKVLRLNATSVVVEDTDSKRQQTLPMTEDAQG